MALSPCFNIFLIIVQNAIQTSGQTIVPILLAMCVLLRKNTADIWHVEKIIFGNCPLILVVIIEIIVLDEKQNDVESFQGEVSPFIKYLKK
jgi:hypothetical protein